MNVFTGMFLIAEPRTSSGTSSSFLEANTRRAHVQFASGSLPRIDEIFLGLRRGVDAEEIDRHVVFFARRSRQRGRVALDRCGIRRDRQNGARSSRSFRTGCLPHTPSVGFSGWAVRIAESALRRSSGSESRYSLTVVGFGDISSSQSLQRTEIAWAIRAVSATIASTFVPSS